MSVGTFRLVLRTGGQALSAVEAIPPSASGYPPPARPYWGARIGGAHALG
ncbi:hypothetical protein HYPSUDRAFT_206212 [Hypholoma sublateritium FD-334 SS-4]|uniref:Uncharacterized protein n=1 Tax=Hypholoma sublateritium (strain FD-334 SS-4) TaxID=945553 RepID=A0A0D2M2I3_HYPSF|nr:hypothetical protein HYPSUDRAFT_206212 [Hypholoma sublateritium FD-334 SS-4]